MNEPASARPRLLDRVLGLLKRKLLRDSGFYLLGSALPRALGVFLLPVWTAYLTPGEFGTVSTTLAAATFIGAIFGFGMTGVMNRFYIDYEHDPDGFRAFFSSNMATVLSIGLVLCGVVLAFGQPAWAAMTEGQIPFYPFALTALCLFFGGTIWRSVAAVLRVERRAGEAVALEAGSQLLAIGVGLVFVVTYGMGAAGRMWGEVAGSSAAMLLALYYVARRYGSLKFSRAAVVAGFGFGLPLIPHIAAHWTLSFSNRVIIAKYSSVDEVGLYGIAGFVGLTLAMVQQSVAGAWTPIYLRWMRDDTAGADEKSRAYFCVWIALMGAGAVGAALFGRELVSVLADESYFESWVLIMPVALAYFFYGLYIPAVNQLVYFKQKKAIPILTVSAALVQVVGGVLLVPKWGAAGGAISLLIAYGCLAIGSHVVAGRRHRVGYPGGRIFAGVMLVVTCSLVSYASSGSLWWDLLLKSLTGLGYLAVAYLVLVRPYLSQIFSLASAKQQ